MTAKANGCVEIKQSTLYALVALITILGLVASAAAVWGALNNSVGSHQADKASHLTERDVMLIAPTRGEYEQTLKSIDESLGKIDTRLNRIEDKVYGR